MDRELLDMPNVIPETEGADQYFYFEDVAGLTPRPLTAGVGLGALPLVAP